MGNIQDRWTKPDPENPKKRIKTDRHGSGSRWLAEWLSPDGKRHRMAFKTKDAAQAHLDAQEVDKRKGTYVQPNAVTVGDLWPKWRAAKARLRPTTLATYDSLWGKHIGPEWAETRVRDVRLSDVEGWMATLTYEKWDKVLPGRIEGKAGKRERVKVPMSGSQSRRAGMLLASVLDLAVKDRHLPANPLAAMDLPSTKSKERRPLTDEQVAALVAAMHPHEAEMWTLVKTGMRWGEMGGLLVRDLDVERQRLSVHRGYVEAKGERFYLEPKTDRHREVPVKGDLLTTLTLLAKGRDGEALLFVGPGGYGWTKTLWRTRWRAATLAVGLPGIGTHILRHTAASRLIRAGADPKVVQRMLGHAAAAMTMDLYGHLMDGSLDDAADRMEQIFEAKVSSPHSPPRRIADSA